MRLILLEFFITHCDLPYAQSPHWKAPDQLKTFPSTVSLFHSYYLMSAMKVQLHRHNPWSMRSSRQAYDNDATSFFNDFILFFIIEYTIRNVQTSYFLYRDHSSSHSQNNKNISLHAEETFIHSCMIFLLSSIVSLYIYILQKKKKEKLI